MKNTCDKASFTHRRLVTCGADGFLRCSDLISRSSSIVISPEYDREDQNLFLSPGGLFSLRPGMCFSHHFVDTHNGLLCSERGLRRFDIRVSPSEQQSRSVLSSDTCKACAVWSSDSVNSSYVFGELRQLFPRLIVLKLIQYSNKAGGASANVALYDLRMVSDGQQTSKVVQLYRPRHLDENASVSVSGIDISKNKKELLISYENDQIYSFPIFPSAGAAGPTVDALNLFAKRMEEEETVQPELCSYGGHLNRYTFLKVSLYSFIDFRKNALLRARAKSYFLRMQSMRDQMMTTFALDLILDMRGFTRKTRVRLSHFSMLTIQLVMALFHIQHCQYL